MKKTHIISALGALSLAVSASAIAGHAYVSGLAGYGGAHESLAFKGTDKMIDNLQPNYTVHTNANWLATGKAKKGGLVERLAAGYQFNHYFGLELGATHYANTTIDLTGAGPNSGKVYKNNKPYSKETYTGKYTANGSVKLSTWVADALAKVTVPFGATNLYGFAKGGVAYVNVKESGSITTTQSGSTTKSGTHLDKVSSDTATSINQKIHAIRPEAAVGLGYKITPHVSTELTGDYVFGSKNKSIPNLYYVGVGLNYNF